LAFGTLDPAKVDTPLGEIAFAKASKRNSESGDPPVSQQTGRRTEPFTIPAEIFPQAASQAANKYV
jgi:hypothetical protein